MSKIRSIIIENARTFYRYDTGRSKSIWPRYVLILLSALALVSLFHGRTDNFYIGIITAQSILVGFAFNVMIFITANPIILSRAGDSIERRNKIDKLNTLAKEVFFNLAYFNITAIGCVILSLLLLLVPALSEDIVRDATEGSLSVIGLDPLSLAALIEDIYVVVLLVTLFGLYYLLVDSLATFLRVVQRASFYFEKKIALSAPAKTVPVDDA